MPLSLLAGRTVVLCGEVNKEFLQDWPESNIISFWPIKQVSALIVYSDAQ